ncbi:hypothetical protein [Actinocrispum wychmicini]|uniref:Excreted virulence factor EspC (Type VII ESX diderm) n=1 Tax=Actinocrispum wychmicini TaxID=1213861 RepID=A0A4R2J976_9PSEU|nr:hypothetical protein [Actinocrispum wychmicini]TCO54787.1 hypothetical protein EV192_10875 [Actinocrispum wychmicini]
MPNGFLHGDPVQLARLADNTDTHTEDFSQLGTKLANNNGMMYGNSWTGEGANASSQADQQLLDGGTQLANRLQAQGEATRGAVNTYSAADADGSSFLRININH